MLAAASPAEAMAKVEPEGKAVPEAGTLDGGAKSEADDRSSMQAQTLAGGATAGTASANPPRRVSQYAISAAKLGSAAMRNSAARRSSALSTPSTYSAAVKS